MNDTKQLREALLDILDKYDEARLCIVGGSWYEVNDKSLNSILDEIVALHQAREQEVRKETVNLVCDALEAVGINPDRNKVLEKIEALSEGSDKGEV